MALERTRALELRDRDGRLLWSRARGDDPSPGTELKVAVSLPRGADQATQPIPIVMGLHGLGGSIDTTLPLYAEYLGEGGFAYVTIDGVNHGSRAEPGKDVLDALFNFADLRTSLGAFVQTVADLVQLRVTLAAGITVDGVALDGNSVGWSGGSYGGINGLLLAAVEPSLNAFHVEACGAPWRDVLAYSEIARPLGTVKLIQAAGLDGDVNAPEIQSFASQYFELAQWIIDAGDASAAARHLVSETRAGEPPRRLLMQYWQGETLMPNEASERVVRALGVPVGESAASADGVAAVWPYDVKAWGVEPGPNAHGSFWQIPEARRQALAFLRSAGTAIQQP